ncbi:hypothetical protein [Streptomyces sp. NPDC050560]|uniref:hypothetical protein n=1 Tax=Streptomyces sp. NPDC050560 TaxID=3365630 RepID=UPI0037A1CF43
MTTAATDVLLSVTVLRPDERRLLGALVAAVRRHRGRAAEALELHTEAYRVASTVGYRIEVRRAREGMDRARG